MIGTVHDDDDHNGTHLPEYMSTHALVCFSLISCKIPCPQSRLFGNLLIVFLDEGNREVLCPKRILQARLLLCSSHLLYCTELLKNTGLVHWVLYFTLLS